MLVVDDSEGIHRAVANALEDLPGVSIVARAYSGEQAMRAVHEHRPDAVLLDIEMPGATGLDVLRAFHGTQGSPLFIMFTLHACADLRQRCMELGALELFEKAGEWSQVFFALQMLARLKAHGVTLAAAC